MITILLCFFAIFRIMQWNSNNKYHLLFDEHDLTISEKGLSVCVFVSVLQKYKQNLNTLLQIIFSVNMGCISMFHNGIFH